MAKGFGIAGLVLAILSVFAMYGFNIFTIWIAMICCTVAALNGERPLSIASVVIALAGILLFSPITLAVITMANGANESSGMEIGIMTFLPMTFPVVAMVMDTRKRRAAAAGSPSSE